MRSSLHDLYAYMYVLAPLPHICIGTSATQVVFGEHPVQVVCPNGGHLITTNVAYRNGTLTYLLAALLCFIVGPICALIPFCVNSVKDVVHTCPEDGTVIGVYKRM